MKTTGAAVLALALALGTNLGLAAQTRRAPDWIRFRGPNGSGVSAAANVPVEFGRDKNVLWRLELPT